LHDVAPLKSVATLAEVLSLFLSRSGATIMELPGAPKNTYAFMWLGAQAIRWLSLAKYRSFNAKPFDVSMLEFSGAGE